MIKIKNLDSCEESNTITPLSDDEKIVKDRNFEHYVL